MEALLPSAAATDAVPVYAVSPQTLQGVLTELPTSASGWVVANRFKAESGAVLAVPGEDGQVSAALFGLGEGNGAPLGAANLATALPAGIYRLASGFADPFAACLAFALGAYRFTQYKANGDEPAAQLAVPGEVDLDELGRIVSGVYLARDLINRPANDLGPEELAAAAGELARRHGAEFKVTVGEELLEANFPMIHAVGKASTRAPRLIDMRWGNAAHPRVTLVGKGVVFDTGGLDIKPSSSMLLMKKDMGGAANVLGLASMIMASGLKLHLRVLIPAVENAIAGNAFRPGDILPSRKGLSVEIGNTDAEGRLVLADALALADEESPELLIDMATLTGAARVALGPELSPFYTDDEGFADGFAAKGEAVTDPLWRMPLWKPYAAMLESKVADINHISSGPFGGSITAALFLARFVEKAEAWVHLDIYGWNPAPKPGRPLGGEAQGIRALYALLKDRYAA
ncbi:leucyl aminopeptidase family protein [Breoghania sp. L-A4]|uniref:leucyl aminopeptidase family protein n=1 Tax=Breoghania sp. L-A4 TaxID=2304600 RepID=UPI000E3581F3|nr:leucyl aminopeptidase family protein [Breoghania sp. L-A4]AXS42374.1 leucyl aminopeptidase family protein [Breoghania sp. L-A4]